MRTSLPALAVLLAALLGGSSSASAQTTPTVSAEPPSVSLGETATVTATGLGELTSASFGLADPDSGAFSGDGIETGATAATAPVSDGTASIEFTPTRTGDVVIAVGTGETVLAQVTVSIEAATAEPAPVASSTPTPSTDPSEATADESAQAEPDSEAEAGRFTFVLIPLIAAAVVVIGGIVVITRGRRKRRGD